MINTTCSSNAGSISGEAVIKVVDHIRQEISIVTNANKMLSETLSKKQLIATITKSQALWGKVRVELKINIIATNAAIRE